MSPRKRTSKPYGGQITTAVPWLDSPDVTKEPQATESKIKLTEIHLPASQPRRYFDPQALEELAESIKQHGLLQPLLVRPLKSGGYELVAGERRYRSATKVGLTEVPVVVRELSDEQAWQLALIENLQREDLNPIEETEAVLALLSIKLRCDVSEVKSLLYKMKNAWDKVGKESASEEDGFRSHVAPNSDLEEATKSRSHVAPNSDLEEATESRSHVAPNSDDSEKFLAIQKVFESLGLMSWITFITKRLPLLNLPEGILVELREGKLEYSKAVALARVKDEQQRQQLLEATVSNNWSLSQIKEQVKQQTPPSQIPSSQPTSQLPERLKVAYQKLKKTRLWEDPNKEQQIDTLLTQLEALLEND
ncbi:MAG: ParB/RepB/Spo0J family partition protein [Crinalium sp.]